MGNIIQIFLGLLTLLLFCGAIGWILWRWLKKSDEPLRLVWKWIVSLLLLALLVPFAARANDPFSKFFAIMFGAICGLILAAIWMPNITGWIAKPFGSLYDGGDQEIEPQPLYSIAEARRKQGKYLEAVAELRKQLARFPDDFKCLLMLSEIQAENLNDLAAAQHTVDCMVNDAKQSPVNMALALNRLADWHLKLGHDPATAHEALERIVQLFPDTEQAYLAGQRMAHLTTAIMLAEKDDPRRIKLGQYQVNIGLLEQSPDVKPPDEEPGVTASNLVRHLEEHPQDAEAREKLARVYAEHYQRLDLAVDQIEQLIAQSSAPDRLVVHWLNLLAGLQIKHGGDLTVIRDALQRIVDLFPQTAAAETAMHRIAHLQLELRAKKKSQVVKLGSYEQNLGLKDRPGISE